MKHVSTSTQAEPSPPLLRALRLGLFTQHEAIVFMRTDCHVCRSEGLRSRSQVVLCAGEREVYAILYQMEGDVIGHDEAALSEAAWSRLGVKEGDVIHVRHPPESLSLSSVRRRIYGNRLDEAALRSIIDDIAAGHYTDVHMAAFLTASAALPLDDTETISLVRAMVDVGDKLSWSSPIVIDKHCVGGLPGNRTTPIIVAIAAASGLIMPKTSSRAITSPAGTADVMETLAPVNLDLATLRKVVEMEGGCVAWGGSVQLSPADDLFIQIERELDIDAEGQLIASVLSKKIAAGSTHVIIDIPVGPTAKVRTEDAAKRLALRLVSVGEHFGLKIRCMQTDGSQPVGRGVGPALEAMDVLAVLQNTSDAPQDLRTRACQLAGAALELAGAVSEGTGVKTAESVLKDGRAWAKFQRICEAQGGIRNPPKARLQHSITAVSAGSIVRINNRKIAKLAKLAGAPDVKAAGLQIHVKLGSKVKTGAPILTVHADTTGELAYALDYARLNPDIVEISSSL